MTGDLILKCSRCGGIYYQPPGHNCPNPNPEPPLFVYAPQEKPMTSELCEHGMAVCEDCAFERGQMWAINLLECWHTTDPGAERFYDGVAEELREAMERLKLEKGFHDS